MLGIKKKNPESAAAGAEQEAPNSTAGVNQDIARFTKRKSHKKRIAIAVVAVVVVGAIGWKFLFASAPVMAPVMSTALQKTELVNSISLTGTVESAEASYVHTTLNSTVNTVAVKVGDHVEAGDLLAQLDTSDLELSIAEQQAVISKISRQNQYAMENAQKKLEDAKSDISNNVDAELIAAENALRSAQQNLNDARRDLNEHKDDLDYADEVMNNLEKKLNRARDAYQDAEKEYNIAVRPDSGKTEEEIKKLHDILDTKEKEYEDLLSEWNKNDTEYGGSLSSYSKEYRSARIAYENALANKNAIENSVNRNLDNLETSIKGQEIDGDLTSQQISLKKLQKDLSESTVTAPISGTVTAVYAKEGVPAAGLLFVVENTDDLVIKTALKEYDVATVQEGMPTEIKSDATGEEVFEGTVGRIYPTAVKASDGSTRTDGGVEFETEVSINDPASTGLRVGMNVRLNIVTQKKENVWAVPFEAVGTDAQGQSVVYVAKPNEEGAMIATAVPVTTGMETDFYLEISSDGLADGDQVLSDASTVIPGMPVTLAAGMGGAAPAGAVMEG
ncbi:efflux RND transporter periplasmic adaptor subunit [Anaerotruncus massiliensis (ex Togo et al. 2019)]|uniref:efflux RND transporter periplasmic adaptor subunit n=1 Tax=Anaerotruncus massiliensis (ex Togo et al. 2019) TaxID=1673720 RepID=UPI0023F4469C|nr:efflux RND transporter periplasmic adaptor subunit [Anaerotruncus massiliensis (ex Togo et al. 2019)]